MDTIHAKKYKEIDFKKLDDKLKPSDVDFKVQTVIPKGDKVYCILVAYKDARVDQNVLDRVVGKENWQVKYRRDEKGILFCSVGINNVGEWIWKESNGTESFTESEKGEASDAFKRAGFMWGIGRCLYNFPEIKLQLMDKEWYEKDGKIKIVAWFKPNSFRWKVSGELDDLHIQCDQKFSNSWKVRYDNKPNK